MRRVSTGIKESGLAIEVRGFRLILISKRGGYQEIDITPVYHYFEEFFRSNWKKEWEKLQHENNTHKDN